MDEFIDKVRSVTLSHCCWFSVCFLFVLALKKVLFNSYPLLINRSFALANIFLNFFMMLLRMT